MDVLSIVFIILPLFLCDSCSAQVKNASLPLVIWHGMGRCVIYRVSQVCREGKVMRTTSGRCNLRNRGTNVKTVSCIIKSYTVCGIFSFLNEIFNQTTYWKVFRIGTVRYNWPMSAHASQAFSIAHGKSSELVQCAITGQILNRGRPTAAESCFVIGR